MDGCALRRSRLRSIRRSMSNSSSGNSTSASPSLTLATLGYLTWSGKFGPAWRSGFVTRDVLLLASEESLKVEIPALSKAVSCHLLFQIAVRLANAMSCDESLSEIHGAEKCLTTCRRYGRW